MAANCRMAGSTWQGPSRWPLPARWSTYWSRTASRWAYTTLKTQDRSRAPGWVMGHGSRCLLLGPGRLKRNWRASGLTMMRRAILLSCTASIPPATRLLVELAAAAVPVPARPVRRRPAIPTGPRFTRKPPATALAKQAPTQPPLRTLILIDQPCTRKPPALTTAATPRRMILTGPN